MLQACMIYLMIYQMKTIIVELMKRLLDVLNDLSIGMIANMIRNIKSFYIVFFRVICS